MRNQPNSKIDIIGKKTYDFVNDVFYASVVFVPGDEAIAPDPDGKSTASIKVKSGNMWPFSKKSNLQKIQCLLAKLGFTTPPPKDGIYLGDFKATENGWTITYGFMEARRVAFFQKVLVDNLDSTSSATMVVTMYHELKGHNQDNQNDGPAFDLKYEQPVRDAIVKMKSAKYPKDRCPACGTGVGAPWVIKSAYDSAVCDCEIDHK